MLADKLQRGAKKGDLTASFRTLDQEAQKSLEVDRSAQFHVIVGPVTASGFLAQRR